MAGMLETVIPHLPTALDIRILPIQAIGKSNEHVYAPGTLTLPAATLIEAWSELGASVARAGVRKIVFVNSHGGNEEIMGIVARELRVRHAALAVKTSWQRFGRPAGHVSEAESRYGIHGGDVETSLMLWFRPDLVDMAAAQDFASRVVDDRGTPLRCFAPTPAPMRSPGARPISTLMASSARRLRATALKGRCDGRVPGSTASSACSAISARPSSGMARRSGLRAIPGKVETVFRPNSGKTKT